MCQNCCKLILTYCLKHHHWMELLHTHLHHQTHCTQSLLWTVCWHWRSSPKVPCLETSSDIQIRDAWRWPYYDHHLARSYFSYLIGLDSDTFPWGWLTDTWLQPHHLDEHHFPSSLWTSGIEQPVSFADFWMLSCNFQPNNWTSLVFHQKSSRSLSWASHIYWIMDSHFLQEWTTHQTIPWVPKSTVSNTFSGNSLSSPCRFCSWTIPSSLERNRLRPIV